MHGRHTRSVPTVLLELPLQGTASNVAFTSLKGSHGGEHFVHSCRRRLLSASGCLQDLDSHSSLAQTPLSHLLHSAFDVGVHVFRVYVFPRHAVHETQILSPPLSSEQF